MATRTGRKHREAAFLNIPYDRDFEELYLAYIAGIAAFGLTPRATLEVPGGTRRLDRIFDVIRTCQYSFHDLSRVEVDPSPPPTPRFNMPFELGLAVACERTGRRRHTWFVFESVDRRAEKSLSDLKGTDIYVHEGSPAGLFRELGNALVNAERSPEIADMEFVYSHLRIALPNLRKQTGAKGVFEARLFRDLVVTAQGLAARLPVKAAAGPRTR